MLTRLLVLSLILSALAGWTSASACGSAGDADRCIRILFIGNSYIQVNELPGMVEALARAGSFRVETVMGAEGGASLADQLSSPGTVARLRSSRWDFVVVGSTYVTTLPAVTAQILQAVAGQTVLTKPGQWNLP